MPKPIDRCAVLTGGLGATLSPSLSWGQARAVRQQGAAGLHLATRAPSVSVVGAIRSSVDLQDVLAIDRDVWAAVRAMKDWPTHDLFPQHGF